VFRRRSTTDDAAVPGAGSEPAADALGAGVKGRPTPKRKEAEAARKQRLTPPRDRKEAAKRMKQKRYEERMRVQSALKTGDESNLPRRDRGPVRRFCRDLADSRRSVAEYLLPLLMVVLALSFVATPAAAYAQLVVWLGTIIGTVVDTVYLVVKVRRELARRFPRENIRGAVGYTILRSSQLRRFRLPKPRVERGATLPERY
jgi:hypothetical protein